MKLLLTFLPYSIIGFDNGAMKGVAQRLDLLFSIDCQTCAILAEPRSEVNLPQWDDVVAETVQL